MNAGAENGGGPFKRYRLQDRDKHLLALLATCRYLTTEQIRRLCFPGRTETPADKRLRQLGGIGKYGFASPLVERRIHRTYDGQLVSVWRPTIRGYATAHAILPTVTIPPPKSEIPEAFLEHTLVLNSLFVGMAEAPLVKALANRKDAIPRRRHRNAADGLYVHARSLGFRWIASDSIRLPWQEHLEGGRRERVICPDAVLELPEARRRLFLECEMGTQTIVAPAGDKPGSTIAKLERYLQYFRRLKDPSKRLTYYAAQYPDAFTPEVLYLVRSKARADHVNEAISVWSGTSNERGPAQRALTFPAAIRELLTTIGQWCPELESPPSPDKPGPRVLTPQEIRALATFYRQSVDTIRADQQDAQKRNAPVPQLPPNRMFVRALLSNLLQRVDPSATL